MSTVIPRGEDPVTRSMEQLELMALGDGGIVLDSPAISARQEEYISKLRKANEALRNQLRAYSKALEVSMSGSKSFAAGSGLRALKSKLDHDGKKSLRALVATKEKSLVSLRKKVEVYKKSVTHLKKQLRKAYTSERVIQIGNENKEKEKRIQQLLEEKRNLVNIHRAQAKQIQRADVSKEEWPERVAALQEELRFARDRYKELKLKIKESESMHSRQHEQMVRLTEKNKELLRELKELEASHGVVREKPPDPGSVKKAWEKERRGLTTRIHQLEKANRREKVKLESASKRSEQVIQGLKLRIDGYKEKVDEREKEMRAQLLQVKKLKRNLRELAMGDLPQMQISWNKDLEDYFTGDKEVGEGLRSPQGPNPPASSPKQQNHLRENRIKDATSEELSLPVETKNVLDALEGERNGDNELGDVSVVAEEVSPSLPEEEIPLQVNDNNSGEVGIEQESSELPAEKAVSIAAPVTKENTFAKPMMRRKRKGKAF